MGTHDSATRDRLLRERPVPNLQRCIEALRANELSKVHKEQLRSTAEVQDTVHVARKQNTHGKANIKGTRPKHARYTDGNTPKSSCNQCRYCGTSHAKDKAKCPAYGKRCNKCGKSNHFAAVCQGQKRILRKDAKKVHQISGFEKNSDTDDSLFTVHRIGAAKRPQSCPAFMVPLTFHTNYPSTVTVQLDTGATCSAMSHSDLLGIVQIGNVKLDPPKGKIKLYDGRVINPLGTYTLTVSQGDGPKHSITFDILENAPWPIIDGNTCIRNSWISLQPQKSVNMLQSQQYEPLTLEQIMSEYNDVFTGLGCLPGKYYIDIDPIVRPVQHAPRRVPVPLTETLRAKIDEMEKQDLNKAIRRPKYQLPTVDELLPKLAKAKIFTVLDAKDGFFQVKLDEPSSYLTTFWTPFGRYRYLRMPQGISSAPEEYQRRQNEVLAGLNGVEEMWMIFYVTVVEKPWRKHSETTITICCSY
ncbi:uncharacterized protein [Ptychodera flava]|uniref:uncharacterized protein n=1 Tax=Ptychodera flava TaxID=63121 RepID=UPI00396A2A78